MNKPHQGDESLGLKVILLLAILVAIEFAIAVSWSASVVRPVLAVFALVKAVLIVSYLMRVSQLWHSEG